MTQPRMLWAALGGVALAIAVGAGMYLATRDAPYEYSGFVIEDSQMELDIELLTASGEPFVLSDSRAPVTAVYFGYTHCPDVCPTTMLELAAAREALPEKRRDDLQVVMVTVDPERDTPEVMDTYVHHFDDSFVGLSGTPSAVADTMAAWGVVAYREEGRTPGSYLMSHPATVNVIDARGRLRLLLPLGIPPDAVADDLLHLMEEG